MKKIISIVLLVIMLFTITSCNVAPVDTNTDTSNNKDSNSDTSVNSGTNNGENDNKIEYTEDKNKYEAKTNEDGTLVYLKETLSAPTFTSYYHNYKSAVSFTFDDGYDVNTGYIVNDVFSKYGFRGTLMLNGMYFEDSARADAWRDVVSKGYLDVGSHGYSHINPLGMSSSQFEHEIKYGIEFLREQFPDQNVITYATAFAQITDEFQEYLDEFVISNRLEAGGALVKLGTEFNPYRIKAFSLDEKNSAGYEGIKSSINQSLVTNTWMVMLCHCVKEDASGVDLKLSRFEEFCQWLYSRHNGEIWVASFEDVSIYNEQLKNAKINYLGADYQSLTFNVECDLDKNVYNFPMSIVLPLPSYADSAYAVINGVEFDLTVENSSPYNKEVVVLDVPTDGTEVKVIYGGNKNYKNGCVHHIYKKSFVKKPTCTERGYTEMECMYCMHVYYAKYEAATHTYDSQILTKEEIREDGKYTITYRKCLYCENEKVFTEKLDE